MPLQNPERLFLLNCARTYVTQLRKVLSMERLNEWAVDRDGTHKACSSSDRRGSSVDRHRKNREPIAPGAFCFLMQKHFRARGGRCSSSSAERMFCIKVNFRLRMSAACPPRGQLFNMADGVNPPRARGLVRNAVRNCESGTGVGRGRVLPSASLSSILPSAESLRDS